MPQMEQVERIGGATLLGVPAFDFFVWALDTYGRGEMLISLHEHLPPVLTNPATSFLCMCGGLGLLYWSQQKQLTRMHGGPQPLVGVEQYRKKERPGWLLPFICAALIALVLAPVLAIANTLSYIGKVPRSPSVTAPLIAYDKTPPLVQPHREPKTVHQGPCSTYQEGGSHNQATVNCGPPPVEIKWSVRDVVPPLISEDKHTFKYEKQVTVTVDETYTPISLGIVCDEEIKEVNVGMTVNNFRMNPKIGVSTDNKRVGVVYFEGTPVTPDHPLYLLVWSDRPFSVLKVQQVDIRGSPSE